MKKYLNFDKNAGYLAGVNIFYECSNCKDIIESIPKEYFICSCKNISFDIDCGRLSIKNHEHFKIFKKL
jgi:hypothetical protein